MHIGELPSSGVLTYLSFHTTSEVIEIEDFDEVYIWQISLKFSNDFMLGALEKTSISASHSNTAPFVCCKISFAVTPIRWAKYFARLEEKTNAQAEGVLPL